MGARARREPDESARRDGEAIFRSADGEARALALEKFVMLILQLDNPSFYKQFDDVKKMYMRELEANFGNSNQNLSALLEDADFMLTFSVVSIAKN